MQERVGCTPYQANAPSASGKSTSAIQRTGSAGSNAKAMFAWLEEKRGWERLYIISAINVSK